MLCLSIKEGDGFTIGAGIVVRIMKKEHGTVKVVVEAPKELGISRVDGDTAHMLIQKIKSIDR